MTGFIYAIGDDYLVKIGWSKHPKNRYSKIRADSPVDCQLFGVIDGSTEDEAKLHKHFRPWHLRGEWYFNDGLVANFIKTLSPAKRGIDYTRAFKPRSLEAIEPKPIKIEPVSEGVVGMETVANIMRMEEALRERGLTVKAMLAAADVSSSQWQRWKNEGQIPLRTTWYRIETAFKRMVK